MPERRYSDNWMPDWLHLLVCAFCRRVRADEAARRSAKENAGG